MSDKVTLKRAKKLKGSIVPPPDKSISHRAVMCASLANGKSIVKNFLRAEDTISTLNAFRKLGVKIEDKGKKIIIVGQGLHGLKEPADIINCGNSGTTTRLLSGILAVIHSSLCLREMIL